MNTAFMSLHRDQNSFYVFLCIVHLAFTLSVVPVQCLSYTTKNCWPK